MPPPALRALFRHTPTVAPVPHRSILSVSGSDAPHFLNGILSSTVPLAQRNPFFSSFLHAQGRVLYDVFVYTQTDPMKGGESYLIEYDARSPEAPPLMPMLKRYVLRSKVKIRDASDQYDVWASWGSEKESIWETPRKWNFARSGAIEPVWDASEGWPWGAEDCLIRDRRAVGMGHRRLVRKGDRPPEAATHDEAQHDAYLLHRILHGVPESSTDIVPMQAFPMDSNLDVMGALDFRKGCYVGQELTVRTYHTGVVRKRVLPVIIHSGDEAPLKTGTLPANGATFQPGLDVRASVNHSPDDSRPMPRPRGTGKLLSSTQGVGLALLRLEHVEGWEKGDIGLSFEEGEQKTNWSISPWWPDWWPRQTE
ncbi:Aminomethyltransferase folate-binding domain-containing protein [Gloeophyllum trabeum ATCC 11539]|uniref:Aminomethyltransferase folate-binding domain-containing protein n=1 Tax=Gloeophyllum trabeum (strain ATCC 11539 / FP-39264 / Madison 617) TaxID=670483 RepID=S7QIV3_GLOTA|nr:Aminomethyltransferase folate-binding domain-containing protein [Gloeophyllum trabeum ATCC 11539]EPQ59268.1 Aminomethyltransferase folate-binding domain-containing protein [Gloeophyllum trabeum ATCC 11539]